MNKGWQGNYFEDFELGARWVCPVPRTVTAGDVACYVALTGDRTPVYCGPSGLVHPLVSFHAIFGQTVRQISLNARANLGYADIRWLAPVRVGDTLSTEVEVTGLKENSSGTTGIVYVKNVGRNQRGDDVLSFSRWVMVKKRDTAPTRWLDQAAIPTLPKSVAASDLAVFDEAEPSRQHTAGRWKLDDYEVGERIQHLDGMSLNPSDHMSLTRLFQNSAKVHFDALAMKGRPLVYGGVVISHCYAISFNGLENRYGIAAINGGTHANPAYAGDTIYCFTDIIEKVRLTEAAGALRLRMVGLKNLDPVSEPDMSVQVDDPKRPGRKRHHPSVILDLDYWELVSA